MASDGELSSSAALSAVDETARPQWQRTGFKFFPYAARQTDQWWVLRFNYGFPEHDMYTLFVDGRPAVDITGSAEDPSALVRSVALLRPHDSATAEPKLDAATAAAVVRPVAQYVDYGSERGDPCLFCSEGHDGMDRT